MSRDFRLRRRVEFVKEEFELFVTQLWSVVNAIHSGKTRNTGSVTLNASTTTTVVNDPNFESSQVVVLTPTSSTAAAEEGTIYVSSKGNETFTLTHSNTADVDKTFDYVIHG